VAAGCCWNKILSRKGKKENKDKKKKKKKKTKKENHTTTKTQLADRQGKRRRGQPIKQVEASWERGIVYWMGSRRGNDRETRKGVLECPLPGPEGRDREEKKNPTRGIMQLLPSSKRLQIKKIFRETTSLKVDGKGGE